MANSPQEVLVECREHDVKAIALRAADLLGRWHQLTIPVSRLNSDSFEDGFLWTGGNLGCADEHMGDVLWIPQPGTSFIEPFAELPTLCLICNLHDPLTREELPGDPRNIALRASRYLIDSGIAEEARFSIELEFFLLDSKAGRQSRPMSREAASIYDQHTQNRWQDDTSQWRRGFGLDPSTNFRDCVMQTLVDCGVEMEGHRQGDPDRIKGRIALSESNLVTIADRLLIAKHVLKRAAARVGKVVTFMPVPPGVRGSAGLVTQFSLIKHNASIFAGPGYAGLSDAGLHAIGGLLNHAPGLCALANASTNSYARLHGQGPMVLSYSESARNAAVRIPSASASSKSKQLELRTPDAAGNAYLSLSAILMAAIDGIQNKTHPGTPVSSNPNDTPTSSLTRFTRLPSSLDEALESLSNDADFLVRGDVFPEELLESWITIKRQREIARLRAEPHPAEVSMYFDV